MVFKSSRLPFTNNHVDSNTSRSHVCHMISKVNRIVNNTIKQYTKYFIHIEHKKKKNNKIKAFVDFTNKFESLFP